jgi:hypothetical protein
MAYFPNTNQQPTPDYKRLAGNTARKRTPLQRAKDLALLDDLHSKGKTLAQIAAEIAAQRPYTLTLGQLSVDMKRVRKAWAEQNQVSVAQHTEDELKGLKRQENELWTAWERSKREKKVWTKERNGKGRLVLTKETGEQQIGDPRYMALILSVRERKAALLGLDKPKSVEVTGEAGGPLLQRFEVVVVERAKELAQAAIPVEASVQENGGNGK